jgi:hypothetical protein
MEIPFHVNEFIVYPMSTPKKVAETVAIKWKKKKKIQLK